MPVDVLIVACSVIFFILGFLAEFFFNKFNQKKQKIDDLEDFTTVMDTLVSIKTTLNISSEEKQGSENKPRVRSLPEKKKSNPIREISSDLRLILNRLNLILNRLNLNPSQDSKSVTYVETETNNEEPNFTADKTETPNFIFSQDSAMGKDNYEIGSDPNGFDIRFDYSPNREPSEERYRRINIDPQFELADDFIRQYNQAFIDRKQRQQFWDNYKNVCYFGNKNAAAQARGENLNFDFRTKDGGDFIAVKLPNDANFLVVPRFDTTISNTTFHEGGFGEVFQCFNYLPNHSYSLLKVEKPAVFRQNGDQWILVDQGKMLLQA